MRPHIRSSIVLLLGFVVDCVAPTTTQPRPVSPEGVHSEQLKQQQLVISSDLLEQQRVADVAYPLLKAAVPLCPGAVTTRTGVRFANVHTYAKEYQQAATALGFSDTLTAVMVIKGSPAERAGIRVGDRMTSVRGLPAPVGPTALRDLTALLADPSPSVSANEPGGAAGVSPGFRLRRGLLMSPSYASSAITAPASNVPVDYAIAGVGSEAACSFNALAVKNDALNAWADGKNVFVTTAMLRFATTDDELAVVLSHEITHDALGHIQAKQKNSRIGAFFGVVLDIAAASQGINTYGDYTSIGAKFGAMRFSQDFEREADYAGIYLLARAGRPIAAAPDFWRRMAQESPESIKFASSHPTTAERFVRLENAIAEIEQKRRAGEELLPERKTR